MLLSTARLWLRPVTLDDRSWMVALFGDPAVMRYVGPGEPFDEGRSRAYLEDALASWAVHGYGPCAVIRRTSDEVLGACGLERTADHPGAIAVTYALFPAAWDAGFATEALRAVVAWAFSAFDVDALTAVAHEANRPSHRVLVKSGFTRSAAVERHGRPHRQFTIRAIRPDG